MTPTPPDLLRCTAPSCWFAGPPSAFVISNEAWACPRCGMDESGLESYWSDLGRHQAAIFGNIVRGWSDILLEARFKSVDESAPRRYDDRMIASSTDDQAPQESPITISVTRLHPAHRKEVLTNPDFLEFVEDLAERVRVLLAEDNEDLSERMTDLVVDLFRPDDALFEDDEGLQRLQELETAVTKLTLEQLAPLLVRICTTGDWRES